MSSLSAQFSRISLMAVTGVCACLALTACSSETSGISTPTKSASATNSASSIPSASVVQNAGSITGLSFEKSCESILSSESLYKINPNYAFAGEASAPAGPQSELVAQLKGKTCKYVNTSGGAEILVSIAQVSPESTDALLSKINELGLSQVDVYGQTNQVHGYFATIDGTGIGIANENQVLVVASSTLFSQSTDPSAFILGTLNSMK